jgi:hypothetical protein
VYQVLTSDPHTRGEIVSHARGAFEFLGRAGGRPVAVDDRSTATTLVYVLDPVTVEVELDWQEAAAFLLLGRTVAGKRPPGYYMHDGKRMRVHLAEVLGAGTQEDRAAAQRLRQVTKLSGPDAMRAQLQEYAEALHRLLDRLPEVGARYFGD